MHDADFNPLSINPWALYPYLYAHPYIIQQQAPQGESAFDNNETEASPRKTQSRGDHTRAKPASGAT